jgi:hypothetical protein
MLIQIKHATVQQFAGGLHRVGALTVSKVLLSVLQPIVTRTHPVRPTRVLRQQWRPQYDEVETQANEPDAASDEHPC